MPKTCPSCRYREPDPQAMYCNKCGYPFPAQQPRQVPQQPPRQATPASAARPAPRSAKQPARRRSRGGFPDFGSLITENHLKLIYILGAALIVLVSVMGIAGMFKKPGATDKEEKTANATLIDTKAIAEYPAGSPVFWVGFLVVGSILWRMFCELFALLSRLHGGAGPDAEAEDAYEEDTDGYTDVHAAAPGGAGSGQMVECPKCHRIVPIEDLRECEHCGIQGCTNCIRLMGLLKKKLTCRECFEGN